MSHQNKDSAKRKLVENTNQNTIRIFNQCEKAASGDGQPAAKKSELVGEECKRSSNKKGSEIRNGKAANEKEELGNLSTEDENLSWAPPPKRQQIIPNKECLLDSFRCLSRLYMDSCQRVCGEWWSAIERHLLLPKAGAPRRRARKFLFSSGEVHGGREVGDTGFVETNSHKYKREWRTHVAKHCCAGIDCTHYPHQHCTLLSSSYSPPAAFSPQASTSIMCSNHAKNSPKKQHRESKKGAVSLTNGKITHCLAGQRVFLSRPDNEDVTLQVYPLNAPSADYRIELIVKNLLTVETATELCHFLAHLDECHFAEVEFEAQFSPTSAINPLLLEAPGYHLAMGLGAGAPPLLSPRAPLKIYSTRCGLNDIYTADLLLNFHTRCLKVDTVQTFVWRHPSPTELAAMMRFILTQGEFCRKLSFQMKLTLKKVEGLVENLLESAAEAEDNQLIDLSQAIPLVRIYSTPSFKPPETLLGVRAELINVMEHTKERALTKEEEDGMELAMGCKPRPQPTTKSIYRFTLPSSSGEGNGDEGTEQGAHSQQPSTSSYGVGNGDKNIGSCSTKAEQQEQSFSVLISKKSLYFGQSIEFRVENFQQ